MRSRFGRLFLAAIVLLCNAVSPSQARDCNYKTDDFNCRDSFSAGLVTAGSGSDQFSSGDDFASDGRFKNFSSRLYGSHFTRLASAHIGDTFDDEPEDKLSQPHPAATIGFVSDVPVSGDPFTGWYQTPRKSKDNIRVKYFVNALLDAEKLKLGSFQAQLTFTRLARVAPTRDERLYCLLKACRNDLECTSRAIHFIPEMTSYNMRFLANDFEQSGWTTTASTLRHRMKPLTECLD